MRNVILVLVLLAVPLCAQTSNEYRTQGTVFFAPGASSPDGGSNLHIGVGALGRIYKGLGVGADVGYLFPPKAAADGVGLFSANGYYHFNTRKSDKLVPFVTGGFSGMFRQGWLSMGNVGGGVDYWFRERAGLTLEFRDHIRPYSGETLQLWEFRIGFSFR